MATVNLGRIKFVWQGAYSGATAYVADDVVSYNGSSYICILASTGNLPTNATYWSQMSSAGTNGTNGTDLGTTLTTQGDIVYRDASGLARLGAGTSGQVLTTQGSGANPSWSTVSSKLVNYTTATNSTRFSATISTDETYGSFNFTKQQSGTTLYITGAVPTYANDNGGTYEYGKIGSTYKYIGIHYVKGDANTIGYGGLSFNQVWTGIGSGSQTFSFGQKSINGTSNRPNLIINPNSSEDARNQQTGWSFIVWELET